MTEEKENYWKEKYADVHIRLTNRIAELEQENEELTFKLKLAQADYEASEQENEKLRKATEISVDKINVSVDAEAYHRLKQENDELKRDNKRMKAILEGCGLEENGDCTYCNVDKAYHELKQENDNLKSCLEEIREIAKKDCGNCKYNQNCNRTYKECDEIKFDDILDKINEVLGNENN